MVALFFEAGFDDGWLSMTFEQIINMLASSELLPSAATALERMSNAMTVVSDQWRGRKLRTYGALPPVLRNGGLLHLGDATATASLRLSRASPVLRQLSWPVLRGILRCFQREEVRATVDLIQDFCRDAFYLDIQMDHILLALSKAPGGACYVTEAPWQMVETAAPAMTQLAGILVVLRDEPDNDSDRHGNSLRDPPTAAYPPYGSTSGLAMETGAAIQSLVGLVADIEQATTRTGENVSLAMIMALVSSKRQANSPTASAGALNFAWEKLKAKRAVPANHDHEQRAAGCWDQWESSVVDNINNDLPIVSRDSPGERRLPSIPYKTISTLSDITDFDMEIPFGKEASRDVLSEYGEIGRTPMQPAYIKTVSTLDKLPASEFAMLGEEGVEMEALSECSDLVLEEEDFRKQPRETSHAQIRKPEFLSKRNNAVAYLDRPPYPGISTGHNPLGYIGDERKNAAPTLLPNAAAKKERRSEYHDNGFFLGGPALLEPFLLHFHADIVEGRPVYLNQVNDVFRQRSGGKTLDYRSFGFERLTDFLAAIPGLEVVGSRKMARVRAADQEKFAALLGSMFL